MAMEIRTIKGSGVVEIYITATPAPSQKAGAQSEELFCGAAGILRKSVPAFFRRGFLARQSLKGGFFHQGKNL